MSAVEPARRLGLIPGEVKDRDEYVQRVTHRYHDVVTMVELCGERGSHRPMHLDHGMRRQTMPVEFLRNMSGPFLQPE